MQHLIHSNDHHYKVSFNPPTVGVVLLGRKDLKESRAYSLLGLQNNNFDCKKNVKEGVSQTENLINFTN